MSIANYRTRTVPLILVTALISGAQFSGWPAPAAIHQDFETGSDGWVAMGADASVKLAHDSSSVRGGKGSLRFDYTLGQGKMGVLVLPIENGDLNGMKSLRFWILAQTNTPFLVALQERNGGRYTAVFTSPGGHWQEVWLAPSDFNLATDRGDPKDPDGTLDLDQVGQISIIDLDEFFAQAPAGDSAPLFNLTAGPRTIYLDDFAAGAETLPHRAAPVNVAPIEEFDRPQLSWVEIGDGQLYKVSGLPLRGPGLQATYQQQMGRPSGWFRPIPKGILAGSARLTFQVASGLPCKLMVQLQQTSGDNYTTPIDVPGGSQLKDVSIAFAAFKPDGGRPENDGRLDLNKIKQLVLMDVSGMSGSAQGQNTIWIGPIEAHAVPSAAGAGVFVTGRVVRMADGKPITAATVSLSEGDDPDPLVQAETLSNGSFILKAPGAGTYRLRSSQSNYALVDEDVHATTHGASGVEVRMQSRPVLLLHLLSPAGDPVTAGPAEAAIRVLTTAGAIDGAAAPKLLNGALEVSFDRALPTAQIKSVLIFVRDAGIGCAETNLEHWPTAIVEIKLQDGFAVRGRAVTSAGNPAAGTPVFAFRMNGMAPDPTRHAFTVTDAAGNFKLTTLPPGKYGMVAKGPALKSKVHFINVDQDIDAGRLMVDRKPGQQ